jgi:hypothetical protein
MSVRPRWIKIGSVKSDAQFYPQGRGWWINWKGRTDWCQPHEFSTVNGLQKAVRLRLKFARLDLLALCSEPPRREFQELFALVQRRKKHGLT